MTPSEQIYAMGYAIPSYDMRVSNVSLFNETIARADKAEKALDLANKRITELESELKAAKNGASGKTGVRFKSFKELGDSKPNVWHAPDSFPSEIARSASINSLTTSETEQLFAEVAEQVDATDLKSVGNNTMPVRPRLSARLRAMWRIWNAP